MDLIVDLSVRSGVMARTDVLVGSFGGVAFPAVSSYKDPSAGGAVSDLLAQWADFAFDAKDSSSLVASALAESLDAYRRTADEVASLVDALSTVVGR